MHVLPKYLIHLSKIKITRNNNLMLKGSYINKYFTHYILYI